MKLKTRPKVAIALAMTLVIAASVWFAVPVRALSVTFPSLPSSGILGSTYSFTVKVDIRDTELLPLQSIDLCIFYNTSYSSTTSPYKATCSNLPLNNGGTKNYTNAETGGGAVSVTASASNWGLGYGYGYSLWESTTTPYYFGYGYGYGAGAASITYSVVWTTPSEWPQGQYKIETKITADSTELTQTSSAFTLSRLPSGDGGGGGGEVPTEEPGVTDVSKYVNMNGVFSADVTAKSENGKVRFAINKGTIGLTREGYPLYEISILEMEAPPSVSAEANIVGLVYDLKPDGATFEPSVTLTFAYEPNDLPEGFSEENLVIAMWDKDAGTWVVLEGCSIDLEAHTVTVPVGHFTAFTIIGVIPPEEETIPPEEEVTPPEEETTLPEEEVTPPEEEVTPPEEEVIPPAEEEVAPEHEEVVTPINWGFIGGIIAVVLVLSVVILFLIRRRRAST